MNIRINYLMIIIWYR